MIATLTTPSNVHVRLLSDRIDNDILVKYDHTELKMLRKLHVDYWRGCRYTYHPTNNDDNDENTDDKDHINKRQSENPNENGNIQGKTDDEQGTSDSTTVFAEYFKQNLKLMIEEFENEKEEEIEQVELIPIIMTGPDPNDFPDIEVYGFDDIYI
jgi:hypothetical protein